MFDSRAEVLALELGPPPASSPGPVVAALADSPGSPQAIAVLAGTDPAHLTSTERVDLIRAWERQLAWVAAAQLAAIAALEDTGFDEAPDTLADFVADWCREELACALHVTGPAAQSRLDLARDLRGRLSATAAALADGRLTERKADLIARAVRDCDDRLASAVEAAVLPVAPGLTPPQLRRELARLVLELDPDGAADRAQEAAAGRRVSGPYPEPDGMAGLWALLPAADAATVLAGLDADAARTLTRHREAGTPAEDIPDLDARRADALVQWAHRALSGSEATTVHGRRPHIQVTVPYGTLAGLSDAPGDLAGYGPIDPDTCRRLAADGLWRRLLTDPQTGELLDYGRSTYTPPAELREYLLARYPTCTFPGCARPARRCHLDHIHEWQHGGRTCKNNLHPLCARHHTCKTERTWTVTKAPDGALTWTSPLGRTYRVPAPRLHRDTPPSVPPDGRRGADGGPAPPTPVTPLPPPPF